MDEDNQVLGFNIPKKNTPIIKVIGVGGGGGNAVDHMYYEGIHDVSFVVCNTDRQALERCKVPDKLQLGEGLGAGGHPEYARKIAEENIEDIQRMLKDGTKMVFITAGMGGGTGTGVAPIIAREAKSMDILTVGIVTIPFLSEGNKKIDKALDGLDEMKKHVDALLVINNERLREIYTSLTMFDAFAKADGILCTAAKSIAEIITYWGIMNVDFNDVKAVLKDGGVAIMSTAYAEGEGRVSKAIEEALNYPLLNHNDVFKSKKLLINITFCEEENFMMEEMNEVHDFMSKFDPDVETKLGLGTDSTLGKKIKITILATGFGLFDVISDVEGAERLNQKVMDEEERIKKEGRREGFYPTTDKTKKKRHFRIYTFQQATIDDDSIIYMVEASPTYKRDADTLKSIKDKSKEIEVTKEVVNYTSEISSNIISFG